MEIHRDHINLFVQSKNICPQRGYYIRVVTNDYPEELMATRYYANSLLRFTNGLETCVIPAAHAKIFGDPGFSLTHKKRLSIGQH